MKTFLKMIINFRLERRIAKFEEKNQILEDNLKKIFYPLFFRYMKDKTKHEQYYWINVIFNHTEYFFSVNNTSTYGRFPFLLRGRKILTVKDYKIKKLFLYFLDYYGIKDEFNSNLDNSFDFHLMTNSPFLYIRQTKKSLSPFFSHERWEKINEQWLKLLFCYYIKEYIYTNYTKI